MGQIVPSDAARQMLPGLKTEFMKQFKGVEVNYDRITLTVPSKQLSEDYGWLGQLPQLREFGAERIPKGLSSYTYTIRNKKWEASIRVDNDLFRFEQYGQVKALVGGLGVTIPKAKNKLIWSLIASAASTNCYDGQFMVDTDHVEGASGVQSNKLTAALDPTSFNAARTLMRRFKDDTGELTGHGYGKMMLMVPQELETTAQGIVEADIIISSGSPISNTNKGKAELFVNPYLTDATDWFLIDLDAPVPPVILQEVGASNSVGIVTDTKGSDSEFTNDTVCFGTPITHFNAGFGDWRSIVGNIVAG